MGRDGVTKRRRPTTVLPEEDRPRVPQGTTLAQRSEINPAVRSSAGIQLEFMRSGPECCDVATEQAPARDIVQFEDRRRPASEGEARHQVPARSRG